MPKIESTITSKYRPTWGAYEGIREIIQNGHDGSLEFGGSFAVTYRQAGQQLVVENDGCTLPREALLLGHSTKTDRPDLIGKFGEGLKIGVLALVRAGHSVKIRTGNEVWIPTIERSEVFATDVLVFSITVGRESANRVAVEIGGLSEEDWATMSQCFLFLSPVDIETQTKTIHGSILLDPKHAGRIYVKGIFVLYDEKILRGYNLVSADLDIDRKMVNRYDLQYQTHLIWKTALATRPDLVDPFVHLLRAEAADVDGMDDGYRARQLPLHVREAVARSFTETFGKDAIPVSSLSDSKEVEHLGKRGIIVPKALRAVLETTFGSADGAKARLADEVLRTHAWGDLTVEEQTSLTDGMKHIQLAHADITLDRVEIADFRSPKIAGLYRTTGSKVFLARATLADPKFTLLVLVHEVSHMVSGGYDGSAGHIDAIETTWSDIVAHLLSCAPRDERIDFMFPHGLPNESRMKKIREHSLADAETPMLVHEPEAVS